MFNRKNILNSSDTDLVAHRKEVRSMIGRIMVMIVIGKPHRGMEVAVE